MSEPYVPAIHYASLPQAMRNLTDKNFGANVIIGDDTKFIIIPDGTNPDMRALLAVHSFPSEKPQAGMIHFTPMELAVIINERRIKKISSRGEAHEEKSVKQQERLI